MRIKLVPMLKNNFDIKLSSCEQIHVQSEINRRYLLSLKSFAQILQQYFNELNNSTMGQKQADIL